MEGRDPHLAPLWPRFDELRRRCLEMTRELDERQLSWKPPDDGWSVRQCLGHLAVTHEGYDDKLRPAIERAREQGKTRSERPFRHTLAGRFLLRSVDPKNRRRFRAPAAFQPNVPSGSGAVQRFVHSLETLRVRMGEADGLDLRGVRFGTPVSRLLRLNLGDVFPMLLVHVDRHLLQAQRVIEHPSFPRSASAGPADPMAQREVG